MSGGYEKAIREHCPQAEVCFDPFHIVPLAQRAVDQVRRDEWNAHERSTTPAGKWIKNTRWVAAQGASQADPPPAGSPRRRPASQQADVQSLPAQGGAAAALCP